jgi:hypothetical protein
VSRDHQEEVTSLVSEVKSSQVKNSVEETGIEVETADYAEHAVGYEEISVALSEKLSVWRSSCTDCGLVVLFYKYVDIPSPHALAVWQQKLCERLALTGKVRIATEGINATVAGSVESVTEYVGAVRRHPLMTGLMIEDFKISPGGIDSFTDLRVSVCEEIIPFGLPSQTVSDTSTGDHLVPEEFHQQLSKSFESQCSDVLLLDCRNYYESRIVIRSLTLPSPSD